MNNGIKLKILFSVGPHHAPLSVMADHNQPLVPFAKAKLSHLEQA